MKTITTIAVASLVLATGFHAPLTAHSLYKVDKSPFSTYIACRTGDIVTVIVNESATTQDNGNSQLNRENKLKATLEQFFTPLFNPLKGFDDTALQGDAPEIELNTKGQYLAVARNQADHSLYTKLQVRLIEEVRPGEFVVRGHKDVNINGKPKKIYVTGVIRQRDITPENTVTSDKIADAMIEIEGEVGSKDLRPGFLTRIFNSVF